MKNSLQILIYSRIIVVSHPFQKLERIVLCSWIVPRYPVPSTENLLKNKFRVVASVQCWCNQMQNLICTIERANVQLKQSNINWHQCAIGLELVRSLIKKNKAKTHSPWNICHNENLIFYPYKYIFPNGHSMELNHVSCFMLMKYWKFLSFFLINRWIVV